MTRPNLTPFLFSTLLMISLLTLAPMIMFSLANYTLIIMEWNFFSLNPSAICATWLFDPISMIFSFAVNLISFCVMLFSIDYMQGEKFLSRFIILVALFVLSMNLLIFMPNLITLLLGWDGLGLVSFLLVIFYQNPRSLGAGMITLMTNRIGDALIISSIALLIYQGHWNFLYFWHSKEDFIIIILLVFAAMTKSAQIPFSSWLPAAMAAPTPVSALVHSSTLVTAGVYLLVRFSYFMNFYPMMVNLLLILSASTTLMAGLAAMTENDMKKIIALSTLSQLGIMMMSLALQAPMFTFFHLITHAMFKALLFICAGSVIHAHLNNQDLRLFGALTQKMPFTTLCMVVANISLMGMPFMAGFYSKDMIIELTMSSPANFFIVLMTLFSTILTAAYSSRFSYFTFFTKQNSAPTSMSSDSPLSYSTTAMIILSAGAIFSGAVLNWSFIFPSHSSPLPLMLKLTPLLMVMTGLLFLFPFILNFFSYVFRYYSSLPRALSSMWFITPSVSFWPPSGAGKMGAHFALSFDNGWNEILGALGVTILTRPLFFLGVSLQALILPFFLFLSFIIFSIFFMF